MKENSQQDVLPSYQLRAHEILGDSLQFDWNEDSTMVLCKRVRRSTQPPNSQQVRYCVIKTSTNEVLYQSHLANGSVEWYGNKELQVKNFKGFPTMNMEGVYIYQIEKKKRINYHDYQLQKE